MLLIDYDPEDYQDHMHRWAKWIEDQGQIDSGLKKGRSQPHDTKQKNGNPRQYFPKGYDTEVAINAAVNSLGKHPKYLIHKQVLCAQFLTKEDPETKARSAGLAPADFRRKMAEARKMVDQYMAGIANPLRYTFEAREQ